MRFSTETGSRYEVHPQGMQIRRISGPEDPTVNQGDDGSWKQYEAISRVSVGERVLIVWGVEAREDGVKLRRTITSPVISIDN